MNENHDTAMLYTAPIRYEEDGTILFECADKPQMTCAELEAYRLRIEAIAKAPVSDLVRMLTPRIARVLTPSKPSVIE